MRHGTALLMIAIGAILAYAVTWSPSWIDLQEAGSILVIVGLLGLVVALVLELGPPALARRRDVPPPPAAPRDRERPYEPVVPPPADPSRRRTRVMPPR